MTRRAVVAAALLGAIAACSPSEPGGQSSVDPQILAGRELVEAHCASCHATAGVGDSPLAAAPRFRDLHLRYDVEFLTEALVEGIVTAHDEMPEFEFEPEQADAIVSYLKSLEPAAP